MQFRPSPAGQYFGRAHVAQCTGPHAGQWSKRLAGVADFPLEHRQSDLPPLTARDVALTGAGNQRAQQILPNVYGDGSVTNYLNINAFLRRQPRRQGVYATTRPFTISGPNVLNIDLSLSRNFRIRERGTLTFRAEAFNLTNSVMFGPPTAALNSASFGYIAPQAQSTAPGNTSTARIMQFALKYAF